MRNYRPGPIKRPMTAVQAIAMGDILDCGGKIVRHQGGYWTAPGPVSWNGGRPEGWYLGTSTVDGLVRRGELEYTEHREGRGGRFPIAAQAVASQETAE